MGMVYVIFAPNVKEYDRTIEELVRHHGLNASDNPKLRVHADDPIHCMVLIERLQKDLKSPKGFQSFKNKLTFVYSPNSYDTETYKCKDHTELVNLYRKHLKLDEELFFIELKEFIKTEEEIEAEAAAKRRDLQDWFVTQMRTATNK